MEMSSGIVSVRQNRTAFGPASNVYATWRVCEEREGEKGGVGEG